MYDFITLADLPADFSGPVAIKGMFMNHGYIIVNTKKIEHGAGPNGETAVYAPDFCDGVQLWPADKPARLHKKKA